MSSDLYKLNFDPPPLTSGGALEMAPAGLILSREVTSALLQLVAPAALPLRSAPSAGPPPDPFRPPPGSPSHLSPVFTASETHQTPQKSSLFEPPYAATPFWQPIPPCPGPPLARPSPQSSTHLPSSILTV